METISTLGKLLPASHQQGRDAVHVAVMPVVAGEDLSSRAKLKLAYGTANIVMSAEYNGDDYLGVVDPFIKEWTVKKGQAFWMWLRPGTINGLRHEWTHPQIDAGKRPCSESEAWLRKFADKWNFDYDEMVSGALADDGYVVARGIDLHSARELDDGDEELFWQHIQRLTGKELDDDHQSKFSWSCSC